MSHEATNWAFRQRGLSLAAFRLLVNLADCHNPAAGCFPSQEFLTDRCEMARSSVNRHLGELEQMGLIRRQRRIDPRTKRQLSTRYYLACEAGFAAAEPEIRVSTADTDDDPSHVPTADTEPGVQPGAEPVEAATSRVPETAPAVSHSSGTLTVIEPTNPPPLKSSTMFEGIVLKWPQDRIGDPGRAKDAFLRLAPEAQEAAHRLATTVLIGLTRQKRRIPKLQGYFDTRLFAEFDAAPEIDGDGRYVITPAHPEEWRSWMGWVRGKHGQRGVDSIVKLGKFLPKTRWPEGHEKAATR